MLGKGSASRSRVAKGAAVSLIAWTVVVMVGAGTESEDALLGVRNFDVVWIVVYGLVVLGSLILLIILKPWQGEMEEVENEKKKSSWWLLIVLAILLLLWGPDIFGSLSQLTEETTVAGAGAEVETEVVAEEPAVDVVAQATDLLLIAIALGLVGGLWWMLARRRGLDDADVESDDLDEQQLHQDIVTSMDSLTLRLRDGDDPRTAVLNAYATLESVVGTHASHRSASETPTEHLRRVLARLPLDQTPFLRLAGLYEIARFSDQVVSESQRQQALALLEQARAGLADRT